MATNHTTNYQLNLWEPEDSFLREEFNENSKKIDGALGEIRYRKLLDVTTQSDLQQISVDVSKIRFLDYDRIELFFSSDIDNRFISMRLNQITDAAYKLHTSAQTDSELGYLQKHMLFWKCAYGTKTSVVIQFNRPMPGGSIGAWLLNMSAYERYAASTFQFGAPAYLTWDQLQSFQFDLESGVFPAGSNITLCGVKK